MFHKSKCLNRSTEFHALDTPGGNRQALFLRAFDDRASVAVSLTKADAERLRDDLISAFPLPVAEVPDPIGAIVYVTGDSADWAHGFKVGTEVEIVEEAHGEGFHCRAVTDGEGFHCRAVTDGEEWYVAEADLDVEKPAKFSVGDRVFWAHPTTTDPRLLAGLTRGNAGTVVKVTDADHFVVRFDRHGLHTYGPSHLRPLPAPACASCSGASCREVTR